MQLGHRILAGAGIITLCTTPPLPPDAIGLSKNAPVLVTSREREVEALRLRAEGCTYEEIGRRMQIAKQSAWEAVDRAMTRVAGEMRERVAEVRVLEAARLDAAASAIWPKVLEGDLRAHETWLRNRARYSSLLGLDARQESVALTDNRAVNIVLSPPWEREVGGGAPLLVDEQVDDLLLVPDPESLPEPPFA